MLRNLIHFLRKIQDTLSYFFFHEKINLGVNKITLHTLKIDQYELDGSPKVSSSDAIGRVSHMGTVQVGLEEREGAPGQGGYRLRALESGRPASGPGSVIATSCVMIGKLGTA